MPSHTTKGLERIGKLDESFGQTGRPTRVDLTRLGEEDKLVGPPVGIIPLDIGTAERLNTFRMRQGHAKADRSAVVLHVQRVARYRERLSEPSHDLSVAVERVREFLRIRPIAVGA